MHAWQPPFVGAYAYGVPVVDPELFEQAAQDTLDQAVDALDTSGLPVPVERIVGCGGAAGVILETAKEADLVVMGSRGLGGFSGLLLGSVSHQITHHAPCPVVVIPADPGTQTSGD